MKGKLLLFIFTFFCFSGSGYGQKTKKAIFVIVDGIPADVIEKINTPFLDEIAQSGGYTRAHVGGEKGGYSETPTISAVGYNSLLTGTWVNKHNVWGNDISEPNYNYHTIFRFFQEQYPEKKTAIFSTWQDNRTKLIGEGLPETGSLKLSYHFDGLELDTVNYPHDFKSDYIHRIDEAVVQNAVEYIRNESPDLSWVYLQYTDDMGHKYGDSPEFFRSVEIMDQQIGLVWEAIQYREQSFNEDWVIYITTDHGRTPETGKGHGGQSDRERTTWIVTNARNLNDYFFSGNPGIVDIMPSLADFLKIKIPRDRRFEIDGVPLTGKLSVTSPMVRITGNQLHISWKAHERKGKVKLWLSATNHFKEGGHDAFIRIGSPKAKKETFVYDLNKIAGQSQFYKIVIEGRHNFVNRWTMEF